MDRQGRPGGTKPGGWQPVYAGEPPTLPPPKREDALASSVPPRVRMDTRPPLDSVGIVCVCGKALASIEGAARACECGRVWLITAMQIGGPST